MLFFLSDVTINVEATKINSPPSQRKTDVDSPNKATPSKTDHINLKKSSGTKKDRSPLLSALFRSVCAVVPLTAINKINRNWTKFISSKYG